MMTALQASVLFAALFAILSAGPVPAPVPFPVPFPVPYHAYCRVVWLFATPCAEVTSKFVEQILAYNPAKGCADCHYMLVSVAPHMIKANHTSPYSPMGENITLTVVPSVMTESCRISAQSTSIAFTSLLDQGKNYCNLYKLLSASGLTSDPGFVEVTNEWACLGFGMATCNK